MSSLVQDQADIRATTEAHTDIADVLMSMNGTNTMASLHDIGKATDLKMTRKEGVLSSEIGEFQKSWSPVIKMTTNLKAMATSLKNHGHEFKSYGHELYASRKS